MHGMLAACKQASDNLSILAIVDDNAEIIRSPPHVVVDHARSELSHIRIRMRRKSARTRTTYRKTYARMRPETCARQTRKIARFIGQRGPRFGKSDKRTNVVPVPDQTDTWTCMDSAGLHC